MRRSNAIGPDDIIEAGGIRLNKAAHEVTVDGEPVELSFKEFELLSYFVQIRGWLCPESVS